MQREEAKLANNKRYAKKDKERDLKKRVHKRPQDFRIKGS